jgi:hypothetical protein
MKFINNVLKGPFGSEDRRLLLFFQKLVWGFPIRRRYKLQSPYKYYQKCLDKDGFVVIKSMFKDEASHINNTINLNKVDHPILEDRLEVDPDLKERKLKQGSSFFYSWSVLDSKLKSLFQNESLIKLLFNQYRRNTYIRENPYVFDTSKVSEKEDITELYHLDGLNQISIVLFLNTLEHSSTHMKIKMKKLISPFNYNRFSFDQKVIDLSYNTFDCICEEGDLLIFDASRLYHKACVRKGNRRILHFNIGTGWQKGKKLEKIKNEIKLISEFYSKISL